MIDAIPTIERWCLQMPRSSSIAGSFSQSNRLILWYAKEAVLPATVSYLLEFLSDCCAGVEVDYCRITCFRCDPFVLPIMSGRVNGDLLILQSSLRENVAYFFQKAESREKVATHPI